MNIRNITVRRNTNTINRLYRRNTFTSVPRFLSGVVVLCSSLLKDVQMTFSLSLNSAPVCGMSGPRTLQLQRTLFRAITKSKHEGLTLGP